MRSVTISERIRRHIDALLAEADLALSAAEWQLVANKARTVLSIDPANQDAQCFLTMAEAHLGGSSSPATPAVAATSTEREPSVERPASFAGGRYEVRPFLGEGGKKRGFLAHDTQLDRDVAFGVIKTEGVDDTGRERITREAQSMGRLGSSPHIVSIYEIGTEAGQPYLVQELMAGGDVEGLVADGPMPLPRTSRLRRTSLAASPSPIPRVSCTAISSRATSGSPRTAPPRSGTSGSRSRSTARG